MKFYLIDVDTVKAESLINYNLQDEDCGWAIRQSQDTYLKEIIGEALLDKCVELASGDTLDNEGNEAYKELVDKYIEEYLTAKAQEQVLIPISFKIRNIGVSQDSDTNVMTEQLQNVIDLQAYYRTLSIDKANRIRCFLRDNIDAFPEIKESSCVCGACKKGADLELEANTGLKL